MVRDEEYVKGIVRKAWSADEVFIVLSESRYANGQSRPRVFQISEEKTSLCIFTDYETAWKFCYGNHMVQGRPLLGRIDNHVRFQDLYSVLNIAWNLGIQYTDIDAGSGMDVNVGIATMMEWAGKHPGNPTMILNEQETESVRQGNKVPLDFQEYRLYSE